MVTFKYCNPFKASLICFLYVIVSCGIIFCSSSANLLSSSKYIRVDLLQGSSFDASIVESGHCFSFLSFYQVYLPKSYNCISKNLKFKFVVFSEYTHFLWISRFSLNIKFSPNIKTIFSEYKVSLKTNSFLNMKSLSEYNKKNNWT